MLVTAVVAAAASPSLLLSELVEVRCDGFDQQIAAGRIQRLVLPRKN